MKENEYGMNPKLMVMRTGAGRYIQGEGASRAVGEELARLGFAHVGILAGKRAFEAAQGTLIPGLEEAGVAFETEIYPGFCTAEDVEHYAEWAKQRRFDCLLGVGGGKLMDLSKAVAALIHLPVFTLPTIAATCAAFAPLSVLYNRNGHQETIRYHEDSVAGLFVDLTILADAPPRYLASGIADAYAKSCEYTSMRNRTDYGDIDFGRYIGYKLAHESDEILFCCGIQAYEDNCAHRVTSAFSDAVSCLMGVVGVISGFGAYAGRGSARFAIAHGFNEIIRAKYVPDPRKYLHGEVVGVGILAQLRANGLPMADVTRLEAFFDKMHLPTRLSHIDMAYDDAQLQVFTDELLEHCHVEPAFRERVLSAVNEIR